MQDQQRNLFLAIALSLLVMFGYQYFLPKRPQQKPVPVETSQPLTSGSPSSSTAHVEQIEALPESPRIAIETPRLQGSLSLAGARIDDLTLVDYYQAVGSKVPVKLLEPAGATDPYFVEFDWSAQGSVAVPTAQTIWTGAADQKLTPETPVTLTWDNGAGLVFTRVISVDKNYLFTVKQTIANHSSAAVILQPYGAIVRLHPPSDKQSAGQGPTVVGYYGEGLDEVTYKDLGKKEIVTNQATGGWVGMNDKYWLVATMPAKDDPSTLTLRDVKSGDANMYSAEYRGSPSAIAPGANLETTTIIFAGAKEQKLLDDYQAANGIEKIDRTVDFGFLWYLARPFSFAIHFIASQVGNFGVAILLFNVVLKILLFPLQDRSFHQMARMRDVQPKIAALKEKFGDDREKMATAQMELFKKEKINPASGCLPIFVQLPIFYALYRVLSTTIEMRHAPFFGWVHDLSAPDPTTVFNLFGLLPFTPPSFLPGLGVWPLIYGITMFLQQRMTPTPTTDPTQQRIMMLMPVVFMFFFANFPAGLTIYYSWNAVLTMAQMDLIRRRSDRRKLLAANKA